MDNISFTEVCLLVRYVYLSIFAFCVKFCWFLCYFLPTCTCSIVSYTSLLWTWICTGTMIDHTCAMCVRTTKLVSPLKTLVVWLLLWSAGVWRLLLFRVVKQVGLEREAANWLELNKRRVSHSKFPLICKLQKDYGATFVSYKVLLTYTVSSSDLKLSICGEWFSR